MKTWSAEAVRSFLEAVHADRLHACFAFAVMTGLRRSELLALKCQDARGTHPIVVQERLGHSSIQITLDMYSHMAPGMQQDAAALIGALVLGDREPSEDRGRDRADILLT
jgi:integrase